MPEGLDHRGLRSWRQRRAREASWPGAGMVVQAPGLDNLGTGPVHAVLSAAGGLRVAGGVPGLEQAVGVGRVAAAAAGGGPVTQEELAKSAG